MARRRSVGIRVTRSSWRELLISRTRRGGAPPGRDSSGYLPPLRSLHPGRSSAHHHPFASPFDPPRAPPFGGSNEGRVRTTFMHEEATARARFKTEGAVTHGDSNSSGSTGRG